MNAAIEKGIFQRLIVEIFYWIFSLLRLTWRMSEESLPGSAQQRIANSKVVVFGHFHEDDWPMIAFYFKRPMIVMVSLSKDGSLLTSFLKRIGYLVSRGSSSRGAVSGFKKLVELSRESGVASVSLAVDGPRGPRREIKKGILRLASLLESPIVFAFAEVDRAWIAKSWARTIIPKPFARMKLRYVTLLEAAEVQKYVEDRNEAQAIELMSRKLHGLGLGPS